MMRIPSFLAYPSAPPRAYARALRSRQRNSLEIDWEFISREEGGQRLVGYVPLASKSQSGVTVATGFDLGSRSVWSLYKLGLSEVLVKKLTPFVGYKSLAAQSILDSYRDAGSPLIITRTEAQEIDRLSKEQATSLLVKQFDRASRIKFSSMPRGYQTAVVSLAFQYGNLRIRTPKFWRYVTSGNWNMVAKELRNFGDNYKKRREREALLVESEMANGPRDELTDNSILLNQK